MYYLRELERKDLTIINTWRKKEKITDLLVGPFRYINLDVENNWFSYYMDHRNEQIRCAIVDIEDENVVGLISLVGIDYMNQMASLHIMIGDEKKQNCGAGSYAIVKMLEHAFDNMNLHRIELAVLATNTRAKHVYEKIGFVNEGIKRKSRYKNGQFVDILLYAILKEEWAKTKA